MKNSRIEHCERRENVFLMISHHFVWVETSFPLQHARVTNALRKYFILFSPSFRSIQMFWKFIKITKFVAQVAVCHVPIIY